MLPITEMLEEERKINERRQIPGWSLIDEILPQVRTMEEELVTSLKKAKEEERERIVGILEEIVSHSYDI